MSHLVLVCFVVVIVQHVVIAALDEAALDAVINAGLGCHNAPGLSVSVVKDGKVVLSRGYGVTNINSKKPVTNTTLFQIASLTKAFTDVLLSKVLHDDGRYSINTDIHYILGRNKFNNSLLSVYGTVEDLMTHRMGIPPNNNLRLDDTLTRANLVDRVKYLPAIGHFRDSFYYSDIMYGILAYITEFVSGKSWEDAMTEKVFKPLHMDSSTFGTKVDFTSEKVASPYMVYNGHFKDASASFIRHWALIGGSGSVVSNAEDMAKWMMFHLNGGKNTEGVQVVEENLLQDTYMPRKALTSSYMNDYFSKPETPVTMCNVGYALGWKTGYYRGLPILQHSGGTFGYKSFLTMVPDKNIGVFLAMTGSDPKDYFRGSLTTHLLDVFLGETPWINSSTICSFPAPWHTSSSRSSESKRNSPRKSLRKQKVQRAATHPLSSYAGNYRNEAYGNIDIQYEASSHQLKAVYGIGRWDLTSEGGDKFKATWTLPYPHLNFHFTFSGSGSNIYKLVPSFGVSSPPVFFKISNSVTVIG